MREQENQNHQKESNTIRAQLNAYFQGDIEFIAPRVEALVDLLELEERLENEKAVTQELVHHHNKKRLLHKFMAPDGNDLLVQQSLFHYSNLVSILEHEIQMKKARDRNGYGNAYDLLRDWFGEINASLAQEKHTSYPMAVEPTMEIFRSVLADIFPKSANPTA